MNAPRTLLQLAACLLLLAAAPLGVHAAPLTIDWYTIDAGGAMNVSGGTLELSGTIGQPDATNSSGGGGAPDLIGGFWAPFGVSCPADFNHDGQVDFFDYLDFASAFDAEDPAADFNHDDQVDFFDYLDFAAAFDVGC